MGWFDSNPQAVRDAAALPLSEGVTAAPGSLDAKLDALAGNNTAAVAVDHNYGGVDALRYTTADGAGIADAVIQAYLAADWDAGHEELAFCKRQGSTRADGRWARPLALEPGDYVLVVAAANFGPNTTRLTVS